MTDNVCAIVLAAGQGTRFHGKKQFLKFHGKLLYEYVADTLAMVIPEKNIVVVGVDILGGETRSLSVHNGLTFIHEHFPDCRKVVICEAARALVSKKQIEDIVSTDALSVAYVKPVVDTVVLKNKTYLDRTDCLSLVSPQAFDFKMLYEASCNRDMYDKATDETRLMKEYYKLDPFFLDGDENLYKVTYPKDIAVIEEIYRQMEIGS